MSKALRILLIDDHSVMRMGLVSLLETCPEIASADDAGSGAEGIRKALKTHPDVVIMDLMMPGMDGVETTRQLIAEWPEARVHVLTTFGTSDGISRVLEAGAKGAILKNAELPDLLAAIQSVAAGRRYLSSEIRQIMKDDPPLPELSPRQIEIMSSIMRGFSNAEIATQLGIDRSTVKNHLSILFSKLGVSTRAEAVALALRKQLLKV